MSLRLHSTSPGPPDEGPARDASATSPDPIDSWLNLLQSSLRLPASRAQEVRDELEDHLRARVREQLLAGLDEPTAIRHAVEELGEATTLARRLQRAQRTPIRRSIMHASLLAISVAALGLSVAAYNGAGAPPQREIYQGSTFSAEPVSDSARLTTDPSWTFERLADALGTASGLPVYVHWRSLDALGISRGDEGWTLDIRVADASPETVLRLLNEQLDEDRAVDARVFDGRLEIASGEYFDLLTTRLVSYDVAGIVSDLAEGGQRVEHARQEVIDLIRACVEPDSWRDAGGSIASIHAVGDRIFVQAPERYFTKIEWLLAQLDGKQRDGEAAENAPGVHIYHVRNVVASGVAPRLDEMLRTSFQDEWERLAQSVSIQADPSRNAIIVSAPPGVQDRAAAYIALMDTPDARMLRLLSASGARAAPVVYVSGAVPRRGVYGLHEDMTLSHALIAAGVEPDGALRAELVRDGKTIESRNLEDLLAGDAGDPALVANDTVRVLPPR